MKILSSANKKLGYKSLALCLFMLALCFFNIKLTSALSYESEQGLSFTLNPTIRVTLSSNAMTINDLAPGSTSDSNIIKATVESNAIAGYTLSSTVGNNTTYNTTNMLHTNGTNTFTNLSSNKASLANFDPSTWGYSYAPCTTTECTNTPSWISGDITGTTNSGYNGLPLYTAENPIKLINATTPGSSAVQFKFGAKADTAQLAGTYNNVINFIGVGKIITTQYTINYNANGGSGAPAQETGSSTTGAVQISSTQPTRTDYLFKGWCTEQTSDDTCSGETIQPGGMLGLHPGTTNLTPTVTRTLYAMWGDNSEPVEEMQNLDPSKCTTTAITVVDNRDNEKYLIQRLADGKCWMIDNLRLDLGNSTVLSNTTESNTNASTTTLNYLKNGGGSTSDRYPTAKINNVPWTSNDQNYYSIPMTISTYKDQTTTSYGAGSGKIGVYYNYCAASAGNYCFGNGTSSGSPSGNATEDICPKGWRMPTGDSSGEYQALYTAYSSDVTSFINALSTPLSGYFRSGSAHDQGSYGLFWSSTYSNTGDMYRLRVDSSNVHPSNNDDRYRGLSVRCLLSS